MQSNTTNEKQLPQCNTLILLQFDQLYQNKDQGPVDQWKQRQGQCESTTVLELMGACLVRSIFPLAICNPFSGCTVPGAYERREAPRRSVQLRM